MTHPGFHGEEEAVIPRKPREADRRPNQVFVSHATADKWIAKTLCEKIETTGATTFRDDRDIHGSDDIPDEIRRQIKNPRNGRFADSESVDRQWVMLEIGAAWGASMRRRIVILDVPCFGRRNSNHA